MKTSAPRKHKTPPILFAQSQRLIAALEARLDGPLLCYWISTNGSVCTNDVVAINELCARVGKGRNLYIFIKSDGGTGRASLRMVNLIRQHCARLVALLPLNCESAATMLALGADEIRMGPLAFLTPVDTSITHDLSPIDKDNDRVRVGTNELARIVNLLKAEKTRSARNPYEVVFGHIHPLVVAAVNRAGSLSTMLSDEILAYHMRDARKRKRICETLNSSYPSHSYPIVLKEAKRIGLNVKPLAEDLNRQLMDLNEVYSEMAQHCRTDYDEQNYHNNEILNILEARDVQIYYQVDKDWHYRQTERSWYSTNENSSYKIRRRDKAGRVSDERFHIR